MKIKVILLDYKWYNIQLIFLLWKLLLIFHKMVIAHCICVGYDAKRFT